MQGSFFQSKRKKLVEIFVHFCDSLSAGLYIPDFGYAGFILSIKERIFKGVLNFASVFLGSAVP